MKLLITVKGDADCPPERDRKIRFDVTESKRRTRTGYQTAGLTSISEICKQLFVLTLFDINSTTVVGVDPLKWLCLALQGASCNLDSV